MPNAEPDNNFAQGRGGGNRKINSGFQGEETWDFDRFQEIIVELDLIVNPTEEQHEQSALLDLIKKYQNAPELTFETNFSASRCFSESALSQRIDLLYQIGAKAGILGEVETFNRYTRVGQHTQDVCDRVVNYLESTLGLIELLQKGSRE